MTPKSYSEFSYSGQSERVEPAQTMIEMDLQTSKMAAGRQGEWWLGMARSYKDERGAMADLALALEKDGPLVILFNH